MSFYCYLVLLSNCYSIRVVRYTDCSLYKYLKDSAESDAELDEINYRLIDEVFVVKTRCEHSESFVSVKY